MSKIKDFLTKLIFEDEDENDDIPVTASVVRKPVRAEQMEKVGERPLVAPVLTPVTEKVRSHVVDLTAGEKLPPREAAAEAKPAPLKQTFLNVGEKLPPVEKVEEKPQEEPVKEEAKPEENKVSEPDKIREKARREYVRSAVISPIFGVQNAGEPVKPKKEKKEKEPQLAGNEEQKDSVLGTVLSPLYGDKNKKELVQDDQVDASVAGMSVEEIIATPKKVATVEISEPEIKVIDVQEITDDRKDKGLKARVTGWAEPQPEPEKQPEPVKEPEEKPDLSVTPFGVSKEEVSDESPTKKLRLNEPITTEHKVVGEEKLQDGVEQLSLFDL